MGEDSRTAETPLSPTLKAEQRIQSSKLPKTFLDTGRLSLYLLWVRVLPAIESERDATKGISKVETSPWPPDAPSPSAAGEIFHWKTLPFCRLTRIGRDLGRGAKKILVGFCTMC